MVEDAPDVDQKDLLLVPDPRFDGTLTLSRFCPISSVCLLDVLLNLIEMGLEVPSAILSLEAPFEGCSE